MQSVSAHAVGIHFSFAESGESGNKVLSDPIHNIDEHLLHLRKIISGSSYGLSINLERITLWMGGKKLLL